MGTVVRGTLQGQNFGLASGGGECNTYFDISLLPSCDLLPVFCTGGAQQEATGKEALVMYS